LSLSGRQNRQPPDRFVPRVSGENQMARRIAALVVALILTTAVVQAQDSTFTIAVASADVHKGPSTVTPVIGHVARGEALPVSRNLGSWIRVPWAGAPDGVGFVHVTMGHLSAGGPAPSAVPPSSTPVSAVKPATAAQQPASVSTQSP